MLNNKRRSDKKREEKEGKISTRSGKERRKLGGRSQTNVHSFF
jgi:hypothetical protein